MTLSSVPLAKLCDQLGISSDQLAAFEGIDELRHLYDVPAANAAALESEDVLRFVDAFGSAARIELRTDSLTELVMAEGVSDADIASFVARAANGGPYRALVEVDKTALAERIAGPSPARTVRVFLFAKAISDLLKRGIERFEADAWPQAPAPMVIAVLDTQSDLTGPHLAVLGPGSLDEVAERASEHPADVDFSSLVARREEHVGWDAPWATNLTPWHFQVDGTCSDSTLYDLLRAQLVKLAVLFTCDRARAKRSGTPPAGILAEYRGREHVAIITIDETAPTPIGDLGVAAMLRVVDWTYRHDPGPGRPDWVSDRLPFVQTRIAQALEPHPPQDRLAALTNSMPALQEGIEWHWKAFIEGKVSGYLDQVDTIETIVSQTAADFAERSAGLVKALTDTILAAVAVLIGSFVAAAFADPFNDALFRIGVLTYAGYVLVFPGAIGILANYSGLRAARKEFDARIGRFNEILYPDKVKAIVAARIEDAETTYYRWLTIAATAYLGVVVLAIVAALTVPDLVATAPR